MAQASAVAEASVCGAGIGSGAVSIYAIFFKTRLRRVVSSSVAVLTSTQAVSAMAQALAVAQDIGSDGGIDCGGGISSGAGSNYAFLFKTCLRSVVSFSVAALTTTQTVFGNGAGIGSGTGISSGAGIGSVADIGSEGGIGSGASSINAFLFKTCLRHVVSFSVAALTATQAVSAVVQTPTVAHKSVMAEELAVAQAASMLSCSRHL